MAKHVHRIGRTARAGKRGDAWTLVEEHEAWYFKRMQRRASASADERLDKVKMDKAQLESLRPAYEAALQRLSAVFSRNHSTV